MPQEQLLRPG